MTWKEKISRLLPARSAALIARRAGLHRGGITNITGQSKPRVDKAIRIARVLKVPVEWLFDDDKDWPPPGAADEAARVRVLIAKDIRTLSARLGDAGALKRIDQICERSHRNRESISEAERAEMMAAIFETHRIDDLQRRFEMLNPDNLRDSGEVPKLERILSGHPHFARYATHRESGSDTIPAYRDDFPNDPGTIVPFFDVSGIRISTADFAQLSPVLQRGFVPLIDDIENGPPTDRVVCYQQGQAPPTRFPDYVRIDNTPDLAFAFRVRDDNMEPEILRDSIVICQPGEPDLEGKLPCLVCFGKKRRSGVYLVGGERLLSRNAAGHPPVLLKRSDEPVFYPMIAGPFTRRSSREVVM